MYLSRGNAAYASTWRLPSCLVITVMSSQIHPNVGSKREPAAKGPIYVLITTAHNEEDYIEQTIRSVIAQTMLPLRWVIVSDNCSDRTEAIVESYAKQYPFILPLSLRRPAGRNFGAKIRAWRKGMELVEHLDFNLIGNLDADITLIPSYYEDLMERFGHAPRLGLASGYICEQSKGAFQPRLVNSTQDVPHAAQLIRRECYGEVGGYAILKYGGEDWYAQTVAKMKGWSVQSFPELRVFHHRPTGGDRSLLCARFRLGKLDYSFGSLPSFEAVKCFRRFREKPAVIGSFARFFGFVSGYLQAESWAIPDNVAEFLRNEQRTRMRLGLRRVGLGGLSETPAGLKAEKKCL